MKTEKVKPAEYYPELSKTERELYKLIKEKVNDRGYAVIQNDELCELFDITIVSASNRVNRLKKKGFLRIEVIRKGVPIAVRKMYPLK